MNFRPQNRYLLVQTQAQEDADNTGVLLPEALYRQGSKIVIDASMVENVSVSGETYEIVLENYVVGFMQDNE
ncbi:MAG: hypothetical protein ACYTDW_16550 [Planctomycetota bacterium]|jgi:co-chaperonin GroES (HSP10)